MCLGFFYYTWNNFKKVYKIFHSILIICCVIKVVSAWKQVEGEGRKGKWISKHCTLTSALWVCRHCTIADSRVTNQASCQLTQDPTPDVLVIKKISALNMKTNLLLVHVLVVSLLHHLSLPAFLLQGLLDELGYFALFTRLLSPNNKPAFWQAATSSGLKIITYVHKG